MTAAHRRSAQREREASRALGTPRVHRQRGESAPDVEPVRLACGVVLIPEVKTRARLPALLRRALEQAEGYMPPPAVPLVVFSETGERAYVCLPLAAFRTIAGLAEAAAQGVLPLAFRGRAA